MARKQILSNSRNGSDLDEHYRGLDRGHQLSTRFDDRRKSSYGHSYMDSYSNISRASSTESLLDDISIRAQNLFHTLDPHQRGFIKQEDFYNITGDLTEEQLSDVFAELDHDKDGRIDVGDFKNGLKMISRKLSRFKERKFSRSSVSNYSPPRQFEHDFSSHNYCMRKKKMSVGHPLDESISILSCEENLSEFYQKMEERDPESAALFNDALQLIMKDVTEINKEKQMAIEQYHKEKSRFDNQIHQLEDEYENQIKLVANTGGKQELEKLEREYKQELSKKENELCSMRMHLYELEEESSKRSNTTDSIQQSQELKEQLHRLRRENNNLQIQLSTTQTDLKLISSENVTTKQQLKERAMQLQHERESFKSLEKDLNDMTSQMQQLRDMNRNLQDTNDNLRSAIESSPSAKEIFRKASVSVLLSPLYGNEWKENHLQQCDPAFAMVGKEKYDSSMIDEHGDSGLSTLRDVAELESEIEPPMNATPINLYHQHQTNHIIDDEVFVEHINNQSTDTLIGGKTLATQSSQENNDDDELSGASSTRSINRVRNPARYQHYNQNTRKRYTRYGLGSKRINNNQCGMLSEDDVVDQSPARRQPREDVTNMSTATTSMVVSSMPDNIFKIIFAGDASVGKSTFMMRFCTDAFVTDTRATIGVDFRHKTINLDGRNIGLQLWDTAGQERYRAMTANYFRKADGVLLLYDSTYPETFIHVREWVDNIRIAAGDDIPIMLVANKTDLRERYEQEGRRVVSTDLGENLAHEYNMIFIETSAKNGQNIQECIDDLTRNIIKNYEVQASSSRIDIAVDSKPYAKSQCCK